MKNVYPDVDYGRDLTKNITPNFKYGEFVSSEKAMEYGIKNIPNEQEWQNIELLLKQFFNHLEIN